jgi:hypothetical protein
MKRLILPFILLVVPVTLFAQPGKSLNFAQIAFGGGYETVLNVTNRGIAPFNGSFNLAPSDRSKPFPAVVNDVPLSGPVSLRVAPGATTTLTIKSGNPSLGVLSGWGAISSTAPEAPSLLEGNLTYYIKSENGTVLDSVGVLPSVSLLQAVVPFDDFQSVALALANISNQPATVTLTVFDAANTQVGATTQTLAGAQQVPRFLSQFVPGVSLTKGRVEIRSNRLINGTALTFAGSGQASSLPLLPSMKLYEFRLRAGTDTYTGHVYCSVIGNLVSGYVIDLEDGTPVSDSLDPFAAVVDDSGTLRLLDREGSNEISEVVIPNFNLAAATLNGTFTLYRLNAPGGVIVEGTVTMIALN